MKAKKCFREQFTCLWDKCERKFWQNVMFDEKNEVQFIVLKGKDLHVHEINMSALIFNYEPILIVNIVNWHGLHALFVNN